VTIKPIKLWLPIDPLSRAWSDEARGVTEFQFTCVHCGASMLVDEEVRRLLLADGCVICAAVPDEEAFEPINGRT
jgi:hypothetical protein